MSSIGLGSLPWILTLRGVAHWERLFFLQCTVGEAH